MTKQNFKEVLILQGERNEVERLRNYSWVKDNEISLFEVRGEQIYEVANHSEANQIFSEILSIGLEWEPPIEYIEYFDGTSHYMLTTRTAPTGALLNYLSTEFLLTITGSLNDNNKVMSSFRTYQDGSIKSEKTIESKTNQVRPQPLCECCGKQAYRYNLCVECLLHFYEMEIDELTRENVSLREFRDYMITSEQYID
jgi:hypothetical protein